LAFIEHKLGYCKLFNLCRRLFSQFYVTRKKKSSKAKRGLGIFLRQSENPAFAKIEFAGEKSV
jgi:hypothetical protein